MSCMDRLLGELIPSCKLNICSDECCSLLPIPDSCLSTKLWKDTYEEQSNYYRSQIAIKCSYQCYTQLSVFSNAYPDSPTFMPQCTSFQKTTKLTGACKKVIGNYCTKYMMHPPLGGFLDNELCETFSSNTSSIIKLRNWSDVCDVYYERLNFTEEVIPITCLAYIKTQCKGGICSCYSYEQASSTTFRIIPCPFNSCELSTRFLGVSEYMVIVLFVLLFTIFLKNKFK